MIERDIQTILQRLDAIEDHLAELAKVLAPPPKPAKWMTVSGAAKHFGLKSPYQIRNLVHKGVIETTDWGNKGIVINTESLYRYLESRKRQTRDDVSLKTAEHIINHLND